MKMRELRSQFYYASVNDSGYMSCSFLVQGLLGELSSVGVAGVVAPFSGYKENSSKNSCVRTRRGWQPSEAEEEETYI